MSTVVDVTDATFEDEVLRSALPVVVDFWAEWCAPCRLIGPIVKELAAEMDGKVRFVKIDVDTNPATANQFGILSIPTLIFFRDGQPVDQRAGASSKEALRSSIEQNLVA